MKQIADNKLPRIDRRHSRRFLAGIQEGGSKPWIPAYARITIAPRGGVLNPRLRNKKGFSMIEVMVVVAIVGVMVTLAISSSLTLSVQQQKKNASHEISALITQARFMARGTSTPATITLNTVSTSPGGSLTASLGPPVNWTQSIIFGNGGNYTAVGLVNVQTSAGPFSITPRGTLSPSGFTLTLQDKNYSENGEEILIQVGLLGDITIQ